MDEYYLSANKKGSIAMTLPFHLCNFTATALKHPVRCCHIILF